MQNPAGVYNLSSSPAMTDVSASASEEPTTMECGTFLLAGDDERERQRLGGTNNRGVYNLSSSPAMTDVSASATG